MRSPVVRTTLATVALVALPVVAHAQAEWTLGPFLSYESAHGGHPATAGLATAVLVGPIGLRVSGFTALDQPDGSITANPRWGGDADLMLVFDIASRGSRGGGLAPYVFAGAGMGVRDDTSGYAVSYGGMDDRLIGGVSYGAGLLLPIGGSLQAMGELRQRPSGFFNSRSDPTPRTVRNEFRIGFSLRLGTSLNARQRSAVASPTPSRPVRRSGTIGTASRVPDDSRDAASAVGAGVRVVLGSMDVSSTAGASAPAAARVIPVAERYLGTPYVYGGTSPVTGFDCSGFVQYVYARNAVTLPRTSRQQARVGTRLPARLSALRPGDLLLFASSGTRIDHVAIFAGRGRIIHASSSAGEVRYDDLSGRRGEWFRSHLVAARRVPRGDGRPLDLARFLDVASVADTALDLGDRAPRR